MEIRKIDNIPGLYEINLDLFEDERGTFREVYNESVLKKFGAQVLRIVQQNISSNARAGTTRGIHAEPWNKLVTMAKGNAFGAWVDLRQGDSFGQTHTTELNESKVVFVPRGVGNAYQTIEPDTRYSYLTDQNWSPKATYTMLNLADPDIAIDWPIPLHTAIISDKDYIHPFFKDVAPVEAIK